MGIVGSFVKILEFLNPIEHLGEKKYSIKFPLIGTILAAIILQIYFQVVLRNPAAVGIYAIFVFVALIIYFSFREGTKGGLTATVVTICYYFYLIWDLKYSGRQLASGIQTTIVLGILYFLIAWIIGWLKQTIDDLIERETFEKRRLQTVIEQLPVGIIITNSKGQVVEVNKKLEEVLGTKLSIGYQVDHERFLQTKKIGKVMGGFQSPILKALTSGKSTIRKEYVIERPAGKVRFLEISVEPIQNNEKKVIAAAAIISDITSQKELEIRKDDFVNIASHELKTPITSMKLYIDSLMVRIKLYKDEKANKSIKNIKIQTERLQKLVNDLLDVSRLQTGKLTFENEPFRLDSLVKETIESFQDNSKNRILLIRSTPILVVGDKFRIYQVLTNLLTNAIKYSQGKGDIIVNVKKSLGKALVSVQDFGIGVSKLEQKKIFEKLYQVSDDTEKTFPGFGMGLYISSEIINRHKGNIWVESKKGKGSTFYFTLPLEKV